MSDREQFLYTITPTRLEMLSDGGTAAESEIISQHFNHLQKLTAEGTVLMAGRTLTTGPETIGIVIFYAEDERAAQALMDADPAVAEGVMKAKLYPFRVALLGQ